MKTCFKYIFLRGEEIFYAENESRQEHMQLAPDPWEENDVENR